MKTNTFIRNSVFPILVLFTILLNLSSAFGQVQQNGSLYIGDNGVVSVFTTPFYFGTTGATSSPTETTRSATYGKLYFSAATTWDAATDAHHVNGYVSTYGNADFTFPVGNGTVYAPARVQGASTTNAYDGAYYTANPTTIGTQDGTLEALSSVEYWDVQSSSSALLTLTWRSSSNLSTLLAGVALEDIVIAGWNGTNWVQILSVVDANYLGTGSASDLTAGSITSTFPVSFATYSKFTLAARGSCQPLVDSNGIVRKWDGMQWVDTLNAPASTPTLENPVIIEAAYNAGSFSCNSLVLDADVTLDANQYIEVVNGVTGSSKIIMATSASVVQRANTTDRPTVEMTKTRTQLKRYDYVYFGTPVEGNFYGDMATAIADAPGAVAGAFDFSYKYVTGAGGGWVPTTTTTKGEGFIAHVGQQTPFLDAGTTADVSVVIDGVANNGDVNLGPYTNDILQPNGGRSHILLGNPYPSAIDGDKFLVENEDIDGVLYIWNSSISYPGVLNYSQADYLSYTRAGFVAPAAITATFNGKIPSGQGFKVRITPDATDPSGVDANANITFNNCMRVVDNNSNFYRTTNANATTSTANPKDRFKINMTGANGVFSQILVAYLPEATLGYDRMYDAGRNSVSTAQFYSIFETDGRRLAINARPTFTNTDVVPVGFRKNNTNAETFVFAITAQEGIFTDPNVKVYLHDKVANTYHDFSTGDFTYSTAAAVTNDRFEIVYQTTALSNPNFVTLDATIVLNNNTLAATAEANIKTIQIYDITGRLVENYLNINAESFNAAFVHEESIYVAKITFDNGTVVSKKLIHSKN